MFSDDIEGKVNPLKGLDIEMIPERGLPFDDFNKQYYLWIISNPIKGIIFGAFFYLFMKGSLFSMTADSTIQDISTPLIIFLLAFIVGYQQNVAWVLVRRVVKIF